MELQRQILLFFSLNATPLLDALAQFFTVFGESVVSIAICVFIFLCLDKKKGFSLAFSSLTAQTVMNTAKLIVKFPRPWIVYPDITCKKISTATGYSFPSGHTVTAASLYGAVAVLYKKRWLSLISAVLIVMVGLSRVYLCCHWPLDVAGGLLLGFFFAFFITPLLINLYTNKKVIFKVFPIVGTLLALIGLFVALLIDYAGYEIILYKNIAESLAVVGFGCISFSAEEKFINFKVEGSWPVKIVRYLFAMIGAVFFVVIMKKFVPDTGVMAWLRYGLALIWICVIYPVIAIKLKLLEKENND